SQGPGDGLQDLPDVPRGPGDGRRLRRRARLGRAEEVGDGGAHVGLKGARMTPSQGTKVRSAPSIGALMALIAAGAFGFWMFLPPLRQEAPYRTALEWLNFAWIFSVGVLGGLSLVGPPLLLWESRKSRRRWGPGKHHWFIQGTATWLM